MSAAVSDPSDGFNQAPAAADPEALADELWLRVVELLRQAEATARQRNAAWAAVPEDLRDGPVFGGSPASEEAAAQRSGWPV